MGKLRQSILLLLVALLLTLQVFGAMPTELVPVGTAVGLELEADGIYVVRYASEQTPAEQAGVQPGDIICKLNGKSVKKAEELTDALRQNGGQKIILTILRGGKEMVYTVHPEKIKDEWCMGVYVRDSIAGIGTVTYYDPKTQTFGALGHGVNEAESTTLLPIHGGSVVKAEIVDVVRGKSGAPGELKGAFELSEKIGEIEKNTPFGIFGKVEGEPWVNEMIPIARRDEVRIGEAEILANVEGTSVQRYSVRITEMYPDQKDGRNLRIEVTDPALLRITGGIVQGMSGSPIIQNGKLIGAVTHVLVNDPQAGYGIMMETMLEAA